MGPTIEGLTAGQILAYCLGNKSYRVIAELFDAAPSAVEDVLKHRLERTSTRKRVVKYVVSVTIHRDIVLESSKTVKSAAVIKQEPGKQCSVLTAQCILQRSAILQWKKMKEEPKMTERHKSQSLIFAGRCYIAAAVLWVPQPANGVRYFHSFLLEETVHNVACNVPPVVQTKFSRHPSALASRQKCSW